MRDNLGNTDHEKKQDMQGKPVHGFFYHLFGILKAAALIIIFLIAASTALHQTMTVWERAGLRRQAIWSRQTAIK